MWYGSTFADYRMYTLVVENIKSFLVNSMEKWKVMLCSGNCKLGEVEIKWGAFQGDSLSPYWQV